MPAIFILIHNVGLRLIVMGRCWGERVREVEDDHEGDYVL